MADAGQKPMLEVKGLQVFYGQSHAVQGVDLKVGREVLAVVGRNGMGKTTLCNAIMGLVPSASGSIRVDGREVRGLRPDKIAAEGVGYVPQGRRVWPSLSVDEHLRLAYRKRRESAWTVDRVYQTFPRLAERRGNGGAQLSGGEQQMLAIARALLGNPKLLVLDEPTEGLAPAIVEQVEQVMRRLVEEEVLSVLLIEQNIGVACEVSEEVAVMVNGRITRLMPASQLAADTGLQQSLLGVGRHRDDEIEAETDETPRPSAVAPSSPTTPPSVFSVIRRDAREASVGDREAAAPSYRTAPQVLNRFGVATDGPVRAEQTPPVPAERSRTVEAVPRHSLGRTAYVVGTFDTKADELTYIAKAIRDDGIAVRTVDVSTSGKLSTANVTPQEVASAYRGTGAVFSGDRGQSIAAMANAFRGWIVRQRDLGGIISAGGSGGTSLVTPGMQALPVGVPKIVISTVASGDVSRYVGPVDIMMMYSVVDIQGINSISADILRNGAHALAGMIAKAPGETRQNRAQAKERPAIGITMFGLTTPCVQAVTRALSDRYDCLVFHATGTGGRSMEHLAESGALAGVIDATTTEIADMQMGGVFAANEDRFGGIIRSGLPYVGSLGALDMVNFGALDTLPERYRGRLVHVHNPQVTLMRTTRDENVRMGQWIAQRFSLMTGPTRILIPTGGLSGLDAPGQPFHDPDADAALFEAIEAGLAAGANRRLIRVPAHINDPAFATALVEAYQEISGDSRKRA